MTIKEKILKIMTLAVSIEPTATRHVVIHYTNSPNGSHDVTVWVHANEGRWVTDHFEYYSECEAFFCSYDDFIKKLTKLKDSTDSERQANE